MTNNTLTQFPAGQTQYKINFDYLARQFVVVTLVNSSNATLNRVLTSGNDYRFLNPTTIEILAPQTGFDILQVHRFTSTELLVDFRDGSVLTASSLTTAELQAIHISEEGRDQTVIAAKQYSDAALEAMNSAKDARDRVELLFEAGLYGYVVISSFQAGATITLPNHALKDETTGEYFRWDGVLPTGGKVVPSGSTPASSGGVGLGAWLSVGDAVLRGQIYDPDGASKYPELQMARWRDEGDVRGWGIVPSNPDNSSLINSAISELSSRGGGELLFRVPGVYLIKGPIVHRRGVICKASRGTVTIKLADNSNTGMVESYKFGTLKANDAYSIADDPDFTQDYGFDGFLFDGNISNQSKASLIYGVKMYGRRIHLKRCVIGNVAGVGLWTYCTEQKGGTYTIDKTSIPGCIDELEIMNTFEESWIYDGPSDIPIGSVVTNECGDKSNNGTTPQTSRHFPGQPVHSVHVTEQTSICAKYMNLNGALFGKLLYVADNNRCIIDTLISAGGWGNIEIGVNVSGGINTLYAQANVRNWGGVIKPFVLNRSNKMVFGKVHIRRGSTLPPSDGVVDSGGGVWLQVTAGQASNNGGNLFVADASDIKVNIKAVGVGSTDASGNVSAVLVTTSKADRVDAEILVNNVSLIWRNEKANLNCFVRIQGDVGTGNALMSGVASSPGISKNSLSELKLSCFDGAREKKTNSFFGVGAIDLTSTGGKTVAIQHTLWRAPTVEEIQSSLRHSGFTSPGSFSQAYINSFDATKVSFRVEVTTAATGTPVSQVVCRIN